MGPFGHLAIGLAVHVSVPGELVATNLFPTAIRRSLLANHLNGGFMGDLSVRILLYKNICAKVVIVAFPPLLLMMMMIDHHHRLYLFAYYGQFSVYP